MFIASFSITTKTYHIRGITFLVGVFEHFRLGDKVMQLGGNASLEAGVHFHLHGQPLHGRIPSHRLDVTYRQTNQQVHQQDGHEYGKDDEEPSGRHHLLPEMNIRMPHPAQRLQEGGQEVYLAQHHCTDSNH